MKHKNTYKILAPEERKNFDLSTALRRINKAMGSIG